MRKYDDTAVKELIKTVQCGNDEESNAAQKELYEDNTGLIRSVVKRYLNRGTDSEDLFQIGSIGLIKAIRNFDLSFDVCFSTYAVPMIAGEIRRYLRDEGPVKVSRTVKELGFNNIRLIQDTTANKEVRTIVRNYLPSPSLNEVNYLSFEEISLEYHDELYGYLQTKAIEEDSRNSVQGTFDTWLKNKMDNFCTVVCCNYIWCILYV